MAFLHGLPRAQRRHHQGQVSHPCGGAAVGRAARGAVLHQAGHALRLSSSLDAPRRRRQDRVPHTPGLVRVPRHAVRPHQRARTSTATSSSSATHRGPALASFFTRAAVQSHFSAGPSPLATLSSRRMNARADRPSPSCSSLEAVSLGSSVRRAH